MVGRLVHGKIAMVADGPVRVGSAVAYGRLMPVGNARSSDDTVLAHSASPFQPPFVSLAFLFAGFRYKMLRKLGAMRVTNSVYSI